MIGKSLFAGYNDRKRRNDESRGDAQIVSRFEIKKKNEKKYILLSTEPVYFQRNSYRVPVN